MAKSGKALMTFDATFVIHGYHVYKDIWTAVIGERRNCEREFGNRHDPFAVAIMKDGQVIGHVPRTISCVCTLFIRHGGSILATVTGARRHCTCQGVASSCHAFIDLLVQTLLRERLREL